MSKKQTPQELYDNVCSIHRTKDGFYGGFIDGKVRNEKPCGFCRYESHKGTLSKDLLKNHQCLSKNCHYLVKYSESDFFKERELRNAEKKLKRKGISTEQVVADLSCCICGRLFKAHTGDNVLSYMRRFKGAKWIRLQCGNVVCWKCSKEIKRNGKSEDVHDDSIKVGIERNSGWLPSSVSRN